VHSIGRDVWTEAEDLKLLEALAKHGKRWNIISGSIKGRPAVQCRNRFLSLQRAGKVSEDGRSSVSTTTGSSPTSDTEMTKVRVTFLHTQTGLSTNVCRQDKEPSDHDTIDIDAQPKPSTSSALSTSSLSSPSLCPSSPSSPSSAEPSLPTWDSPFAHSPKSIEGLESTSISTDPQGMSTFCPAKGISN